MVGAVGLFLLKFTFFIFFYGKFKLRSLGCELFVARRLRLLTHKQPSPVVKNISNGDIFRLRLPPYGQSFNPTQYLKRKKRGSTPFFV